VQELVGGNHVVTFLNELARQPAVFVHGLSVPGLSLASASSCRILKHYNGVAQISYIQHAAPIGGDLRLFHHKLLGGYDAGCHDLYGVGAGGQVANVEGDALCCAVKRPSHEPAPCHVAHLYSA